jgi:hypothetical protein
MDSFDSFYQQLDSEQLLKQHGPELVVDARKILADDPDVRVAGVIASPDSREARDIRAMLSGQAPPEGILLVGIVLRPMVETLLAAHAPDYWREQAWQPQTILPVMAATRDGFQFALLPLGASESAES